MQQHHIDGLIQERRNSIANALELRLSCTNPSICSRCTIGWDILVPSIDNSNTWLYLKTCITAKHIMDVQVSCKYLTQGQVTHKCVSKLTIIVSDNGLSPGQRQAIIWTNAAILLIRTLGTNFSEIFSEIHTFSLQKKLLEMSSAKWTPFHLGLNVLTMMRGYQDTIVVCAMSARWHVPFETHSFGKSRSYSMGQFDWPNCGE